MSNDLKSAEQQQTTQLVLSTIGVLLVLSVCASLISFGIYTREDWEKSGQFGDTLGGIANAVTTLIVFTSAIWATREAKRIREQHVREVRGDAARQIWRSVYLFARAIGDVCSLIQEVGVPALKEHSTPGLRLREEVRERGLQVAREQRMFREAVADARLIFDGATTEPLGALWKERQPVILLLERVAKEGDFTAEDERQILEQARQIRTSVESRLSGIWGLLVAHATLGEVAPGAKYDVFSEMSESPVEPPAAGNH